MFTCRGSRFTLRTFVILLTLMLVTATIPGAHAHDRSFYPASTTHEATNAWIGDGIDNGHVHPEPQPKIFGDAHLRIHAPPSQWSETDYFIEADTWFTDCAGGFAGGSGYDGWWRGLNSDGSPASPWQQLGWSRGVPSDQPEDSCLIQYGPNGSDTHWFPARMGPTGYAAYEFELRDSIAFPGRVYIRDTVVGTPPQPLELIARPGTSATTSVILEWSDPSANESHFEVERRLGSSNQWTRLADSPASSATTVQRVDDGLAPGTTYDYRVRAANAFGSSAWSNTATITTDGVEAAQLLGKCREAFGATIGLHADQPHAEDPSKCFGDPVNTALGSYVTWVTDLSLPGIGIPLEIARVYNSRDLSDGPFGIGWSDPYGASLEILGTGDVVFRTETGQRVRYVKQPDGSFVGAPGARSVITAVASGYELTRRDQFAYSFDSTGRLTKLNDPNGNALTIAYGSSGDLTTVTDAVGRTIDFVANGQHHVTRITLPDGRSVGYGYTGDRLTSVTDVRGNTTSYTYDVGGRLKKVIDQNNHTVVHNFYGADGRITEQKDARGRPSFFAWDPVTETATMTDARGNVWTDVYSGNKLMSRTDPLGNGTSYTYDSELNVTAVTDARSNTWSMSYDSRGNLLSRSAPAPLSYIESFTYDSANRLTSQTNGRGQTTTFEYDTRGNLVNITRPGANVTTFTRHPSTGLVTAVADARGKTTSFDYDSKGNLTTITKPSGAKTTMAYDSAGRPTSIVDPLGNEPGGSPATYRSSFTYNAANQILSSTDPLGNAATFAYDPAGNLVSVIDPKNRTTNYGYDEQNRLLSVSAPDASTTTYTYDAGGNLASRTDANDHTTSYAYDKANRLVSVASPTGQTWTYDYDAAGNVTRVVDARGNSTATSADGTTTFAYDAINRLNAIDYSDATPDAAFAYDATSNVVQMTDGAGTET